MKKLLLASAVSAALFGGQAYALPMTASSTPDASTIELAVTAGTAKEIWVAGSSAATPFLENAFAADCTAGATLYQFNNGSTAKTYMCDTGLFGKTINVMHKRDGGGSISGVKAALGANQLFNTMAGLDTATCAAAPVAPSLFIVCTPVSPATSFPLAAHVSDLNLSDVEPKLFESALNGGVISGIAAGSTTGMGAKGVASQIFGIAVNLKLRNAMQVAMVDAGKLAATCLTTDKEIESCMPNMTSQQISTIFANGHTTDWGKLVYGSATGKNLYTVQPTTPVSLRPANRSVHICSRTAGSGTLATVNVKFENAPCFADSEAIQAANPASGVSVITPESGTSKLYHSMSGSGDVENCLEGLDAGTTKGTSWVTANSSTGVIPTTFRWAIGIMGTERNKANGKNYRFVKIDGISPSAQNVAEGKYKFWGEMVSVGSPVLTYTDAPTNTAPADLVTDLLYNFSNPAQISAVNVSNANFGTTGYLGTALGATAPSTTAAWDPARPVNPFTHELGAGGDLNHCRVPTVPNGSKALPALN